MTNEQQTLAELPIWMVILLSLVGGVSGEMWRADMAGARGWGLIRRLALRSGACVTCGLSINMLLYASAFRYGRRQQLVAWLRWLAPMSLSISTCAGS